MVVLREVLAIHRLGERRTKTVHSVWEDEDPLHGEVGVWADLCVSRVFPPPVCPHCSQNDLFKITDVVLSLLSLKSLTGSFLALRVVQIP